MERQFARATPLERAIMYALAIARELVPLAALPAAIGEGISQRELLAALESLRRRMQIERSPDRPAFALQPVILEFVTSQLVELSYQEIMEGRADLLLRHALVHATASDDVRHSQEQLIATPLLEWLASTNGGAALAEQLLLALLASWRGQPPAQQGYGPGNLINLLRLLRGHLRGIDLAQLAVRQVYLQGVTAQDTNLAYATLQDCVFSETFDGILSTAISDNGAYWAAANEARRDAGVGGWRPATAPCLAVAHRYRLAGRAKSGWAAAGQRRLGWLGQALGYRQRRTALVVGPTYR